MRNFFEFVEDEWGLVPPSPEIPGSWFSEHGLPMIVACTCCGSTMCVASALIDEDGQCYCSSCAE